MSKALSSYPEDHRRTVAERRVINNTKGLGYWGAMDYMRRKAPDVLDKILSQKQDQIDRRMIRDAEGE